MTAAMELVSATKAIQYLEDGYSSPTALNAISVPLLKRASKEVCQYVSKTDRGFRLLEDLLGALQNLLRHNGSLFQCLADLGLIELMSDILQAVYQRLRKDGTAEGLQANVEMLLESVNVLGDLGSSAKSQSCQGLCCYLLDLLQTEQLDFQVKMEVVKSTNSLLDQCPTATKEAMIKMEPFQKKIKEIVCLIRDIGDYEFQVGLVECLIRLFPRKSRQLHASQFIRDTAMLEGFLSIKDREFETDCRRFLNDLNSEIDSENVYSIPCLAAFVGNKQLRKPSDSGYDQFWVDFNIGSQRMTLFCEQDSLLSQGTQMDEQLWETVAIYRTDILQCSCSEIQNTILLEIALKQRVCELYPSQHQDVTDNTVRVEFELHRESEIAEAVGKTFSFSEIRKKASRVVNPIHISAKEIQEMDSQTLQEESEEPDVSYQTNMLPPASQDCSARRRKVSVPSIPMRTPVSTPVIPAEQMSQNSTTAAHIHDENRLGKDHKASSATTALKISTRENIMVPEQQKTPHEASNMSQKMVSEDNKSQLPYEKKKQHVKEDLKTSHKQKEFVAPKTPLSAGKMSKPKVKTPVVTVTPPAVNKKKKKGRQQVLKKDKTEKHDDKQDLLPQNNDLDPESIPDSIPTAGLEVKNNLVLKETDRSKNTSLDSGINMDVSSASVGNISRELKEENNVSLPVIQENEPTGSKGPDSGGYTESKLKGVTTNKDDIGKENEAYSRDKSLNKHEKGRTKHKNKENKHEKSRTKHKNKDEKDTDSSDNESHKKDKKPSVHVTSKKERDKEDFESHCLEKQTSKSDKINKSENKAKMDNPNQDTIDIENKQHSSTEAQEEEEEEDDEDKFDFDSQEDKIPDSLEPSIEPSIKLKVDNLTDKPKVEKPKIDKPPMETSITDRYSKILSTKGTKETLRESIEQTAKYIEEEADARSRKNSGALTPAKATDVCSRKSKSFTDNEPSLKELFELEKDSKEKQSGKTKLTSKEKTSKKSKKNKTETLDREESSNNRKLKKGKVSNESKEEEQTVSSRRSLRKTGTNKSYKEIEESDISFVEESQVAKALDEDNFEADMNDGKVCKKEFTTTKVVTENKDQSDNEEQVEGSCFNDNFEEQINDAGSDASSDISEDYRFNNSQASQDLNQDAEMDVHVHSQNKANISEQMNTEETWSKVTESSKSQAKGKQTKNKKIKDKMTEKVNTNKHENDPHIVEGTEVELSESEDNNTSAQKQSERKTKNRKPESTKKNSDKSNCEVDHLFESKKADNSIKQYKNDKKDEMKQGKKDKSKSVAHAQKKEKVKFEEGVDGGHFKHSQMNSMSKKKGKGFVFQMSYCRSETNYKYNNPISGMYKSKFSKGYDPYDFGACENEAVMSEGDSQNVEDKNSGESTFKPRKFFKHSRKDNDHNLDESKTKNRNCNNRKSSDNNSDTKDRSIISPDLNDSLVMSLTSPSANKSKGRTKQDKKPTKGRSRKLREENTDMETTVSVDFMDNSPIDDQVNQTKSHAKSKQKSKEVKGKRMNKNYLEDTVDSTADSESSLVCSPSPPKIDIKKSNRKLKENKQTQKRGIKSDQSSDNVMESDSSLMVSPELPKTSVQGRRKSAVNDSSLNYKNNIQFEESSRSSRKTDRHSCNKNKKTNRSKSDSVTVERKESTSPIEINSDDKDSESEPNQSRTKRLMKQDPVTKKWYRQSDTCDNKKAEGKSHKHRKDKKKKQREGDDSPDLDGMDTSEQQEMEQDVMSDQEEGNISSKLVNETKKLPDERGHKHRKDKKKQKKEETSPYMCDIEDDAAEAIDIGNDDDVGDQEEENCFSRIVKDIVGSRGQKKKGVKNEKKLSRKREILAEKSIEEDSRNITESSFKEFDSEIVDCVMPEDVAQTPCVSASLASTPKFGSASRKRYNPLEISVIKTPVSLAKSVTFDDDVGENDSDKENIVPENIANVPERKPSRSRRRKKSVQYKDFSDEGIDKDERLSLSGGRRSVSSILDSSNNISTRSEKSWILERKKTPKPKPKTYKSRTRDGSRYNSQTESSDDDDNEEDNKSTASRSLSGRTGTLSLDLLTPSLSSLYREARGQVEDENLILTPVTPLKLTSSQHKSEDDIEVYQTQENCMVSLNMDKRHPVVEDMDAGEIGNICMSALGVKTPQKYSQEEDDERDDEHKSSRKKLKKNLKSFLGDSGFASGPSSEVRPSRSTLKRKYPDLVECESGSSDEEQIDETEKSTLVPKKLFKFDHSSILQTVKEEMSDTASTCSDTMETQQQMDFSVQSGGLSSFLAAFAADAKKHFNVKKQKFEALTKTALKSTQKQFTNVWMEQQQYQSGVTDDFQARMMAELTHLEADITQMREAEVKSQEFFKGQLEVLHNNTQSQRTRLENFKKLYSSYGDRAKKVEVYNTTTHKSMMEQLRKEMKGLQKKLIEETQKQELLNVRRGLQNLF